MNLRFWLSGLIVTASLLAPLHVQAAVPLADPAPAWGLAVHGGWWDVGLDTTTPQGIFVGAGVPWLLYLPILSYGGQEGIVAFDASAGYRYHLSDRTSLIGKLLTVWSYDWGDPCGNGCTVHTHRLFFFPVAGIRHQLGHTNSHPSHTSGVMLGIDLSLAVWSLNRSDDEVDSGWRLKHIPVWAGVAFSQVYAGYEW